MICGNAVTVLITVLNTVFLEHLTMRVVSLTEARVRDLPFGSGIWRDTQVKGLLVICHKTAKTYAVQGDVRRNGRFIRTVRIKIDRCDRMGLREARLKGRFLDAADSIRHRSERRAGGNRHHLGADT
ncbi:MAG: hypothetical protein WDN72_06540 [Alphaproteobacteria bacterium]